MRNMKRLMIVLTAAVMLVMSNSCTEDFLTKLPPGSTSESVFYDATGIDALLIGTYAIVPGSSLWEVSWGASIQNWTYGSAASDDAYKGSEEGDQVPVNEIERWNVTTTNEYPCT
jgi:starch-binding outer membrane protein, SusD/RagB family